VLLLLCALALVLRIIKLDVPVWGDEVIGWVYAYRSSLLETIRVALGDQSPWLYYASLHLTIPLLGDTPFGLRLPSVILGILVVPLVYQLMRKIDCSDADSIWAAALVACSSVLIYYSQEARNYSLLVLLSVLSLYAFLDYFVLVNSMVDNDLVGATHSSAKT
jgi:mannosyltransferase